MKRSDDKKGLSPVVASALMLLLILILAILIFLWARGFVEEQIEKFGKPIEEYCNQIRFEAALDNGMITGNLEINNLGNVDIYGFEIEKIGGGNSEVRSFPSLKVDAGEAIVTDDEWDGSASLGMESGGYPDRIMIYPILIGEVKKDGVRSEFTCVENGQELEFS